MDSNETKGATKIFNKLVNDLVNETISQEVFASRAEQYVRDERITLKQYEFCCRVLGK